MGGTLEERDSPDTDGSAGRAGVGSSTPQSKALMQRAAARGYTSALPQGSLLNQGCKEVYFMDYTCI